MFELQTERLQLLPLSLSQLERLKVSRESYESELELTPSSLRIPPELQDEMSKAIDIAIQWVRRNPTTYPWCTHWDIILKAERRTIGALGLAGRPNEAGDIYLGYWLDERYRNQGYMTEALRGLLTWAFEDSSVKRATAGVRRGNLASQRVLSKNGFRSDGESEGQPFWAVTRDQFERSCRVDAGKAKN